MGDVRQQLASIPMRRTYGRLLAAYFLVAIPTYTWGADISLRVQEYGLFRVETTQTFADPTHVAGRRHLGRHVLLQTTDRIPLEQGVTFGLAVALEGPMDGREWTLRRVTRFPVPGLTNPRTGKIQPYEERLFILRVGETATVSFTFDHEWEMVPGIWAFEYWQGEEKLAEKVFVVTKP
jgi:hypothetical protein